MYTSLITFCVAIEFSGQSHFASSVVQFGDHHDLRTRRRGQQLTLNDWSRGEQ